MDKLSKTEMNERLILAVMMGQAHRATTLIKQGANVNAKNAFGRRAIHFSAIYGDIGTLQLLLSHGAHVNVKDNEGMTPLKIARDRRFQAVCELLVENGARENPWCWQTCW